MDGHITHQVTPKTKQQGEGGGFDRTKTCYTRGKWWTATWRYDTCYSFAKQLAKTLGTVAKPKRKATQTNVEHPQKQNEDPNSDQKPK